MGFEGWALFMPTALAAPFFIYGLRNLDSAGGRLSLIISVVFVLWYVSYARRTLLYKKMQIEYLLSWYKIAAKRFRGHDESALRQSFIEEAKKIISNEPDATKKQAPEECLNRLLAEIECDTS